MLRAAAVPVAVLRRPDPAQAEGLPRPGRLPRGDPARPRGRRARGRRVGRQAAQEGPRPELQPHARHARDRPRVRAAEGRHEGDAAPEVAAGRDLRRADAGLVGEDAARGRPAGQRPGQADRRARRDLPLARPADAGAVPHLAAGPRRGRQRPRPRLQRRARHAAGLRTRRRRRARGARRAGGRGDPARQEHGRDVRGADRERAAALEPDHVGERRVRRHRVTAGQPGGDDPDPADVPRRVEGDGQARADVLAQHAAAGRGPAAGRARPPADAARRARAVARPAPLLPRPRPADHGESHRPAGGQRGPARARADAGPA